MWIFEYGRDLTVNGLSEATVNSWSPEHLKDVVEGRTPRVMVHLNEILLDVNHFPPETSVTL